MVGSGSGRPGAPVVSAAQQLTLDLGVDGSPLEGDKQRAGRRPTADTGAEQLQLELDLPDTERNHEVDPLMRTGRSCAARPPVATPSESLSRARTGGRHCIAHRPRAASETSCHDGTRPRLRSPPTIGMVR